MPCLSTLVAASSLSVLTPKQAGCPALPLQPSRPLAFLQGQWVDFFIPHVPAVGGFSFVSTPRQLERCGTFELAVKRSSHPAAAWLHEKVGRELEFVCSEFDSREDKANMGASVRQQLMQCAAQACCLRRCLLLSRLSAPCLFREGCCFSGTSTQARVGDCVAVHVGGCFHYQAGDETRPLLLVAGGIGINPLLSILTHCCELGGAGISSGSSHGSARSSGSPGQHQLPSGEPAGAASAAVKHNCSGGGGRRRSPQAVVLYSASSPAELAFRYELTQLQAWAGGSIRLQLHVTGPEWRGREAEWGGRWGRICRRELAAALHWLQTVKASSEELSGSHEGAASFAAAAAVAERPQGAPLEGSCQCNVSRDATPGSCEVAALVCGPPGMEDTVLADLLSLGLQPGQIRHERWW